MLLILSNLQRVQYVLSLFTALFIIPLPPSPPLPSPLSLLPSLPPSLFLQFDLGRLKQGESTR